MQELGVRLAAIYGGESAEDKAAFAQAVERALVRGLGGQWNLAPDADHCYDAVGAIKEQRREERTAAAASAAAAAAAGEAAAGEAAAGETADAGAMVAGRCSSALTERQEQLCSTVSAQCGVDPCICCCHARVHELVMAAHAFVQCRGVGIINIMHAAFGRLANGAVTTTRWLHSSEMSLSGVLQVPLTRQLGKAASGN